MVKKFILVSVLALALGFGALGIHDSPDPWGREGPRVVVDDGSPFAEKLKRRGIQAEPWAPCPAGALCDQR